MTGRVLVVALAALTLQATETGHALISTNTIDRQATYTNGGERVRASGPVACTRGELISIRVTVIQAATDARASAGSNAAPAKSSTGRSGCGPRAASASSRGRRRSARLPTREPGDG
jgi:hypothetical protein